MIPRHERLDEFGFETWDENAFPLAYLLTFRTFGTWLHGDERTSVKRDGWNVYGRNRIAPNDRMERWMSEEMKQAPFILSETMRPIVEAAVSDLCLRRGFGLGAVNVRTNHVHAVVSAAQKPERVVDALKANATKFLRDACMVARETRVWSRGRSRRYLWKPRHVHAAIEYTVNGQGDFVMPD